MTAKRILAGLLVLLMLVPVFCACNPDTPDTPDVPVSDSDTTPEDTTPPEDKGLVLDVTDFNGTTLRIYGLSKDYAYGYYATDDIWIEADSSDPMEAAVYKRVQDCINKYNFNIQYTETSGNGVNDLSGLVAGGLDEADFFFLNWRFAYAASKAGQFLDMRDCPTIDLNNEWWDQNAIRDLAIANRVFYTAGDIISRDDQNTRMLFFNKTLAENKHLASPYEMVRNNEWTFDNFAQMCRDVKDDVDGSGTLDEDDIIGFFWEEYLFNYLMVAAGERYCTVSPQGEITYTWLQNSEAATKMETIAGLMVEPGITFSVHDYTDIGAYSNKYAYGRGKFSAGKHLFTLTAADAVSEVADMEDDFGMLPLPKWSSDQTTYYHTVDIETPLGGIPNTKVDTTMIGYMLEYLSYEGRETIRPAFYDQMLKRRYAQDSDSQDMLDIIFSTKTFDVAFVCNWNGLLNIADSSIRSGKVPSVTPFTRAGKVVLNQIEEEYNNLLNVGVTEVTE